MVTSVGPKTLASRGGGIDCGGQGLQTGPVASQTTYRQLLQQRRIQANTFGRGCRGLLRYRRALQERE